MSDNTDLGDRMKRYEAAHRALLPRRTYTLLRLDGRSFHTYLRGCQKPFDDQFIADMDAVAEALCAEISGSVFAYTQSDEISILVADFATIQTQPWFDGVVAKLLSISASLATAVLNERRPYKRALFDAASSRSTTPSKWRTTSCGGSATPSATPSPWPPKPTSRTSGSMASAAQACRNSSSPRSG